MQHDRYVEHELASFRAAKDAFLRENPDSPLTDHQRHTFAGLSYFPFDPALRLELPLTDAVVAEPVILETSTGESREYHRAGTIHFTVAGEPAVLTVFRGPQGELFLPLRDATSGEETYGAGRYLEPMLRDDGRVLVDFNALYNPNCAYNAAWSCPLPPRENWLAGPIRAGEQVFAPAH